MTEPLRDVEAVGSLYPRHAGDARQWDSLSTPEQVCVREYLQARKERKRAQALEAAWEARMKMALGTAPRIEGLPPDTGAKALTWRQNKPGKVTDWQEVATALAAQHNVGPTNYAALIEHYTTTKDGDAPAARNKEGGRGMSTGTQAIEEALRMLRAAMPSDGGIVEKTVDAAQDQLEAIRKAAREWAASDLGELSEESGALMEAIAKEAS